MVRRALGVVGLCLLAGSSMFGCRSNSQDAPHGTGAFGAVGGAGGSGGGGAETCVLDAVGQERLRVVTAAALEDVQWITGQTSGTGAGAMRAFGTVIPFTTLELLKTSTVTEVCTGAKSFAPSCSSEGAFQACSELACEAPGVRTASVSIEPLPANLPADGGGSVTLEDLSSLTRFSEAGDGSLAIGVDGYLRIGLGDGTVIRRTLALDAVVAAPLGDTLDLVMSVDGVAPAAVQLEATRDSGALAGSAMIDGVMVATFDETGLEPAGPCGG